jgi:hypothetical protein
MLFRFANATSVRYLSPTMMTSRAEQPNKSSISEAPPEGFLDLWRSTRSPRARSIFCASTKPSSNDVRPAFMILLSIGYDPLRPTELPIVCAPQEASRGKLQLSGRPTPLLQAHQKMHSVHRSVNTVATPCSAQRSKPCTAQASMESKKRGGTLPTYMWWATRLAASSQIDPLCFRVPESC